MAKPSPVPLLSFLFAVALSAFAGVPRTLPALRAAQSTTATVCHEPAFRNGREDVGGAIRIAPNLSVGILTLEDGLRLEQQNIFGTTANWWFRNKPGSVHVYAAAIDGETEVERKTNDSERSIVLRAGANPALDPDDCCHTATFDGDLPMRARVRIDPPTVVGDFGDVDVLVKGVLRVRADRCQRTAAFNGRRRRMLLVHARRTLTRFGLKDEIDIHDSDVRGKPPAGAFDAQNRFEKIVSLSTQWKDTFKLRASIELESAEAAAGASAPDGARRAIGIASLLVKPPAGLAIPGVGGTYGLEDKDAVSRW